MYYSYRSNDIPSSTNPSASPEGEVGISPNYIVGQNGLSGCYIKGQVSQESVATASCLPGKALAVYIALRHQCDLAGMTTVHLPAALLRSFGVSRDAKARALRVLEKAGLVQVEFAIGRSSRITLNV